MKERFGSMTRFAKLAGLEYYDLQKLFSASAKKMTPERKQEFKRLIEIAKTTEVEPLTTDLTPALRQLIGERLEEVGGVGQFCIDHPEFNQFSVWQILNGRRKTVSASVKKLLETLKIQLNEKA